MRTIGTRMGFPADDVETLATMVRLHLFLPDVATRRAHYESQLRWYALALSRLTGQQVRCVLFQI